ncbi:hypothetical protein QQZ08_011580 [Neonectria magnoliae]|uniref:DUF3295 domain-containing protein n=1 Tax=Neonectria magnoliae TaxID=2732573 RepID=A0ABR1H974_9HYPO
MAPRRAGIYKEIASPKWSAQVALSLPVGPFIALFQFPLSDANSMDFYFPHGIPTPPPSPRAQTVSYEPVVDQNTDTDTDDVDESAIDDDSDGWEDSNNAETSQRDDGRKGQSQKSLLSRLFAQASHESTPYRQSPSPLDQFPAVSNPLRGPSQNESDKAPLMTKSMHPKAQSINIQPSLSPEATRRNMLATELT